MPKFLCESIGEGNKSGEKELRSSRRYVGIEERGNLYNDLEDD